MDSIEEIDNILESYYKKEIDLISVRDKFHSLMKSKTAALQKEVEELKGNYQTLKRKKNKWRDLAEKYFTQYNDWVNAKHKFYDSADAENDRLLKENTKLKERVGLVLSTCNEHEKMSDFAIATDSVRAMLTDFPID